VAHRAGHARVHRDRGLDRLRRRQYQRNRPRTGSEFDTGKTARVVQAIDENGGQVKFDGVLWAATAAQPIAIGEKVQVVRISGAAVEVRKLSDSQT